jgi:P-aminobenzoate N-oxygenase AurF
MKGNVGLRLYERSLAGQWNPEKDVDWNLSTAVDPEIDGARKRLINELYWSERQSLWTVKRMNIPIHRYFDDHHFSLCAAAHTFDEARHTYVLERYCEKIGALSECPLLWRVITRVADFLGSSVVNYFYSILVSETLGEVLFAMLRRSRGDALLKSICERALRDESRHIAYLTEGLRRIQPRLGAFGRFRTGIILRLMIYFGLKSLRRTEADAGAMGIDKDAFLDYFERKLTGSIRRAGVERVLDPKAVHSIIAKFHKKTWAAGASEPPMVAELAALEDGVEPVGLPPPTEAAQTVEASSRVGSTLQQ